MNGAQIAADKSHAPPGCFFGAVAAVWLGEKLGRRKSVLVGTTIMSAGAILQITSYSVAQMIVGRIIAGIGNGINTATVSCRFALDRYLLGKGQSRSFSVIAAILLKLGIIRPCSDNFLGTGLADRDVRYQMARQARRHRTHSQYSRILALQLGHIRILLRRRTGVVAAAARLPILIYRHPLRNGPLATRIPEVCQYTFHVFQQLIFPQMAYRPRI